MLADYAVRVETSRGRRFAELQHRYRNDFQRDRDRVIHSRAFRRLENKTQVFTRRYSDHFRNRLTHTLEVAQIARTIAGQLNLNVDLVEALALVHDVGHPPFGHAGEKALDAAFRGLNLTFEVREGIIKHSHDYTVAEHPELAEYLLDQRPPLEAQLIDLADEIAYNTADLDDGFEAHLLSLDQVRDGVPELDRFYQEADQKYPEVHDKLKFNEALKRILDGFVSDLIQNTQLQLAQARIKTVDDVRRCGQRLATFSPPIEEQRRKTKAFLYENLYFSSALDPEKNDAEQIVTALFDFWMAHPEDLPQSYQEKAEAEPLARIVCDYIARMTDSFIYDQHQKYCA